MAARLLRYRCCIVEKALEILPVVENVSTLNLRPHGPAPQKMANTEGTPAAPKSPSFIQPSLFSSPPGKGSLALTLTHTALKEETQCIFMPQKVGSVCGGGSQPKVLAGDMSSGRTPHSRQSYPPKRAEPGSSRKMGLYRGDLVKLPLPFREGGGALNSS